MVSSISDLGLSADRKNIRSLVSSQPPVTQIWVRLSGLFDTFFLKKDTKHGVKKCMK